MTAVTAGAYKYYTSTQAIIATLRENNAKLEVAVDIANSSLETMEATVEKTNALNLKLQNDLQNAELYADELRSKFSRLNLVQEALRDSKVLEGKMNGATANLWRDFMESTGNNNDYPLPSWLQRSETGTGSADSNESGTNNNTDSSTTQTNSAQ